MKTELFKFRTSEDRAKLKYELDKAASLNADIYFLHSDGEQAIYEVGASAVILSLRSPENYKEFEKRIADVFGYFDILIAGREEEIKRTKSQLEEIAGFKLEKVKKNE